MHMKKIPFKKFAGLSRRYQLSLLIGAVLVIVCGAVLGRDKQLPVDIDISPPGPGLYGYVRRG